MSILQAASQGVKDMADGSLRITIEFEPRHAKEAFALFGARGSPLAIAALTQNAALQDAQKQTVAAVKSEPNMLARDLVAKGYFRNPKLWEAMEADGVYTQADHKRYVESLDCCFDLVIGENLTMCLGDVVGHHVRNAGNSGTGMKPPHWHLVPLCHSHHDRTHKGITRAEIDLLLTYSIKLTSERMKEAFKHKLGIESLSEITAQMLNDFEMTVGLR